LNYTQISIISSISEIRVKKEVFNRFNAGHLCRIKLLRSRSPRWV